MNKLSETEKTIPIPFLVTESLRDRIDAARGLISRNAWMRRACEEALEKCQ
jgi:hypothetical protein